MAKVGIFCFDTENYQFVISSNRLCPGLCLPVHGKYVLFIGTLSVFLGLAFGGDVCCFLLLCSMDVVSLPVVANEKRKEVQALSLAACLSYQ